MSNRDELIELDGIIGNVFANPYGVPTSLLPKQAAMAIQNAGYHKPRTITSVAELDALRGDVLILTEQGGYWESIKRSDGLNWWKEPGAPAGGYLAESQDLALPATVIYSPEGAN